MKGYIHLMTLHFVRQNLSTRPHHLRKYALLISLSDQPKKVSGLRLRGQVGERMITIGYLLILVSISSPTLKLLVKT